MKFTAGQIAGILDGEVFGNPDAEVYKLAKIEEGTEGSLTFLANTKYSNYLYSTNATIVIVNKSYELENEVKATLIKVDDAYSSFSKLLEYYNQIKLMKSGIEQPSVISEGVTYGDDLYLGSFCYIGKNVRIGNNVKIYPNSFIGDNVTIGDNCVFFAGVRVYSESEIGNHVTIHSGTIIGSDGFGFAPQEDGSFTKIPQIGNVVIEDHVEIGSCSTVDRATLGTTYIRRGAKLDNQIQVAHNVEIGENTVIAAQTGIAGSTKIGKNCMIGGQVGIIGHLVIADGVKIAAQSGIGNNIDKEGEIMQGSPAFAVGDYRRAYVGFRKLPSLMERIAALEKELKELKAKA
jgi:UDP-3-O-[3-hydroxymyristoyl] glucosamine N-acyltransferase